MRHGHRKSYSGKGSRREFSHNARKTHIKNIINRPMRGGIRL